MDAKKIAQIGSAGTGKSTLTRKLRTQMLQQGFGVLIYDIKNEACYEDVPLMPMQALWRWNGKGEYKISPLSDEDFDIVTVFLIILRRRGKLGNFLFVLEDANGYLHANAQKPIRAVIGACRQWGITVLANYWALSQPPPFYAEMCNYVVLRKTGDKINKPSEVPKFGKQDLVYQAFKEVEAHPDNYYSKTIKLLN